MSEHKTGKQVIVDTLESLLLDLEADLDEHNYEILRISTKMHAVKEARNFILKEMD